MNSSQIAAALRILANAFEASEGDAPAQPAGAAETPKRGRGRPARGEDQAVPASPAVPQTTTLAAVPTASTAEADPFAATPTATQDEVRKALTSLREASSQEKALAVLKKAGGAANMTELTPDKYGVVVAAVATELRIIAASKPAPAVEADPFEVPAATPTPAAKPVALEDVKAAVVAAQKRTGTDTVQKVVMDHGGKANNPETGALAPSLKALPEAQFAAVIAAIQALPTTK